MKNFIQTLSFLFIFSFLATNSLQAQAEWRSNSNSIVNDVNTDIYRNGEVGIGTTADDKRQLNILLDNPVHGSMGIFSDAGSPTGANRVRAIYGTITSGGGYAIGLEGRAYRSTASNGGRAYGVYATAGNASHQANYGVFSKLDGDRTGAAIVGYDSKNNSWNELIDQGADYAGYFVGNVKIMSQNAAFLSFGRTNNARLEMAVANCNTCFSPRAKTNDLVFRKMGVGGQMIFDTGSDFGDGENFLFTAGGQTLLNIKDNGKLGVGTDNTPTSVGGQNISSYKLFVKGGILTDEVRVETGWADYVFEEDYELKTLEEVEEYITENGHLPNVPSAAVVEAQGVELGAITVTQQEKIEEIFLHLIELKKEIDTLKAENARLKSQK